VIGNLLDGLSVTDDPIFLVMATNHIEHIPNSLRRPGRIDEEVFIAPPGVDGRLQILKKILPVPIEVEEVRNDGAKRQHNAKFQMPSDVN